MHILPIKSNSATFELLIWRPKNFERIQNNLNKKFKAQSGSEYARIVRGINFILFNAGRNLNERYEYFFQEEYDSFYAYLEQEEGFVEFFIDEIRNHAMTNEILWEIKISDYEGYNFSNLFDASHWEGDNIIEILNDVLKECENEDQ